MSMPPTDRIRNGASPAEVSSADRCKLPRSVAFTDPEATLISLPREQTLRANAGRNQPAPIDPVDEFQVGPRRLRRQ